MAARIKPGMAGWEAWTLPLCYAVPPKILTVFNVNSWFLALSSSLAVCHGTGSSIVPLSFLLGDIFHESELPMFVNHGSRQKRGPRQIIFAISFVLLFQTSEISLLQRKYVSMATMESRASLKYSECTIFSFHENFVVFFSLIIVTQLLCNFTLQQ